ncbi:MAG TPA: NrsF family protein [Magnetospirillaceae bacterium]|jgi:hypothetical protein
MANTDDLIESLSAGAAPVRRLRSPGVRTFGVVVLAAIVILLLTWIRGLRADFDMMSHDPSFWIQLIGAWLTGITATRAVFEISLPDRSRLWAVLPIPALILWLSGFAVGCLAHWIVIPADAPVMEESKRCLTTIVSTTIPLALALWMMLRRTRPLRPGGTAWVAAIAVAGFADTAHLLLHTVEASALVLVINLIPCAVIVLLGGFGGRGRLNAVTSS